MEAKENKNGSSSGIVSLVCGILALFVAFVPCVGILAIPLEALAIVFGIISIIKANENNSSMGMAIAGVVTAIVALILSVAWIVVIGRGVNEAKTNIGDDILNNLKNNFEWRLETDEAVFEGTDSTMARLGAILDSMNNPASVHLDMSANDTVVKMSITDENGKQVKMDIATRKNK